MIQQLFHILDIIDITLWSYLFAPGLMIAGIYLSYKSKFFQITQARHIFKLFKQFALQKPNDSSRGIPPIHAFFAAIGGAMGIGNLVSVCTAVQIGGPGAVFWMWIAAIFGMLVKYGEIYLGVKFRIHNNENNYTGGPMIFLRHVPYGWFLAKFAAILMCLYGVEIYIFKVITLTIVENWHIPYMIIIPVLLFLVIGLGRGGVKIVGRFCSFSVPFFIVIYISMGLFVLYNNVSYIPTVFASIFTHAFTPHAAIGAFAGCTMLTTMALGVRRACYMGDIGVGYASTVHAETKEAIPAKQAIFGIVDIFLDSFVVCTMSVLLILITDKWHAGLHEFATIPAALSLYFPYVNIIWPFFIFLLGYTTLIGFFAAGRKAAITLSPKYGANLYTVFAICSLLLFSTIGSLAQCLSIMAIVGGLLLICNLYGLFFLRNEIIFSVKEHLK